MKICIVGAGGIGGLLAVKFSQAGEEVTVVDQGLHLEAIVAHRLRLKMADGTGSVATNLRVTGEISQAGFADLVVLGVKAHQIAAVAPELPRLYGPETLVLTVQNDIPWWYFQNTWGRTGGHPTAKLDPMDLIARHIPAERILGCVAYPACAIASPGLVHHIEGNRFSVGELDGDFSQRTARVADLFNAAGLKSYVIEDIRAAIWLKARGALSFNPISAVNTPPAKAGGFGLRLKAGSIGHSAD